MRVPITDTALAAVLGLSVGSFAHADEAKQVNGTGPFGLKCVNPADDPSRAK